ncbi:MarR family winged helix-turn-helix transcriptional regulator [Kutzneria kofuensis]|uniref:DNA-binding MarR family transcriptional regulator n=1 Tax=Kutzneria kofuensis TaxID=103725 RepID=A0A7W9NF80_9PSEU|nr:MarR family transcriptional regulator [Kutzneria kofuensis]MBB5890420.1 DNA-binding MarR family transcriptional regulator [Kutzneria kofuensis]
MLSQQAPEPRLSYLVGRLDRALRLLIEDAVRPHGLTVPQYTTLSVLQRQTGLSNAQLARRAMTTPQSMSEVIAALTKAGLIRREADPAHGRIMRTELTPAGEAVLEKCEPLINEIEARMLTELSAGDRDRLPVLLRSCVRMLSSGSEN